MVDETGDAAAPFAAYLLFVRWARIGAQSPEGHLETDYLTSGPTAEAARASLGAWQLAAVKVTLDALVGAQRRDLPRRRWFDAMYDDDGGGAASD
jgi:hypothetical protein